MNNLENKNKINNFIINLNKILNEHGNHFWYIMKSDKPKLIFKGDVNSKKQILKKISMNPKKFSEKEFVFVKINTGNNGLMSNGKISILCYLMKLNKKLDLIQDPNDLRGKTIWFSDKELLDGKFSFKCIKKIINDIYHKKIDLNPFKITTISEING